jgi:hypothetical protein
MASWGVRSTKSLGFTNGLLRYQLDPVRRPEPESGTVRKAPGEQESRPDALWRGAARRSPVLSLVEAIDY